MLPMCPSISSTYNSVKSNVSVATDRGSLSQAWCGVLFSSSGCTSPDRTKIFNASIEATCGVPAENLFPKESVSAWCSDVLRLKR